MSGTSSGRSLRQRAVDRAADLQELGRQTEDQLRQLARDLGIDERRIGSRGDLVRAIHREGRGGSG